MIRIVVVAACAALVVGCATPKPVEKMPASEAFAPPPEKRVAANRAGGALGEPKDWALQFRRDVECESAARDLVPVYGKEIAWRYLKEGCIAKGGFTLLQRLCDNWTEDLMKRPEAVSLIAGVIGTRGAQLKSDLTIIQSKRIPIFDLGSAINQSTTFKGRYVLVVGVINQIKQGKGKLELLVSEQEAASIDTQVLANEGLRGSKSNGSGSGNAKWRSTGALGSGEASGNYSNSGTTVSGGIENRITNSFEETGQELIVKIARPDPFLRTERPVLFLLRFDGLLSRDTHSEENEGEEDVRRKTALATLVSYHDI